MAKYNSFSTTLKPRRYKTDPRGPDGKKKRIRKYTLEWTLESSIALCHEVQRMENLWHPEDPLYKDRSVKYKSWEEIGRKIGVPREEAVLRWSSLRGNYVSFLKKDKCEDPNKVRRHNPIYAEMKFLIPVIKSDIKCPNSPDSNMRKSASPMRESSPESEFEIKDSPETSPTPWPSQTELENEERFESTISNDSLLRLASPKRPRLSQQNEERLPTRSAMRSMMTRAYDVLMDNAQATDEWGAFGNMITCNARAWATENVGFARRYKAALSAINAKFEMEAAELTVDDKYIVH